VTSIVISASDPPVLVHLAFDEVDWVAAVCTALVVLTALPLVVHSATYHCVRHIWA
jgi:hypothetical protein